MHAARSHCWSPAFRRSVLEFRLQAVRSDALTSTITRNGSRATARRDRLKAELQRGCPFGGRSRKGILVWPRLGAA